MIIVSQDKKTIVNFDSCADIHVSNAIENQYNIIASTSIGMTCKLAEYKTEERAREVLQDITVAYSNFKYYSAENGERKTKIGMRIFEEGRSLGVYEMPEE